MNVDAHTRFWGEKLSLQYASKIKSLPKHSTHDAVFDKKYMKLFDARPNAIRTFGRRIKQFLIASNIGFFTHIGNTFIFCFTILVYQTTEDCAGYGLSEERSHRYMFIRYRDRYRDYIPVYTDGSRDKNVVACVTVFPSNTVISMRLPDSASVLTAEIWAIIKALEEFFFKFCSIHIHCFYRLTLVFKFYNI